MKEVLFTATVDSHINQFHLPYLKLFKENGYEVHVATNTNDPIEYCDVKHKVSFERNPFKINNLKAIKELKKILNEEKFDIIHTHTPMGSVVTRIAAIKTRKDNNTRVIYTAHGFHFYKGAPILNWLIFYPVEKMLSKYTDTLITINKEDYELAKNKFTKTNVEYVPGVGVDENKFNFEMTEDEKNKLREEVGCNKDSFIMIFTAELSKRKNQSMLIKAMSKLVKENNNIHLLLPGKDSMNGRYQEMSKKMNLENNIHFLGYRKDISKLLKISDIAVSSSKQEGLPVNIIEAMLCGLPCIVTNCRGNRDLVEDGKNVYLLDLNNVDTMLKRIKESMLDKKLKIINTKSLNYYKLDNIIKKMNTIYAYNKRKRCDVAIITSGFLPVPASKGGATENLIDTLIFQNEKNNHIHPIIFSTYDNDSLIISEKYDNSDFIFIKPNNLAMLIDKFIYFIIDKVLKKSNSRKFRYFFQRLDFFNKCSILLKKNSYDKVILENHTIMYLALKWRKNYIKYQGKYYYHCHNVVPSTYGMDNIIKNTNRFISVSSFRNNYLKSFLNISQEKFSVVLNCCSNDIYKEATETEIEEIKKIYNIKKEKIILYIGRIDKDKGILELIKACNQIKNVEFKLIIVGAPIFATGITTEYEKEVKDKVLEKKDKYIMTGYVKHDELYKYYSIADVVAIPSQVEDSAPLVLIESLVSGKPIVASDCGGIPEYVNNKCSCLIKRNSTYVKEFAKALETILNDEKIKHQMEKESLKRAKLYNESIYYYEFVKKLFL